MTKWRQTMSRSNDEDIKSFFNYNIDPIAVKNSLKFGQVLYFDPTRQKWLVESSLSNIVDVLKNKATEERFGDIEFALDEKGRPDGIKNKQEIVLTIASDIADSISEMVFEEAKQTLEKDDWIDTKAMEMLKEGKE